MTNWHELEDAYGSATEVPDQLAALASNNEEVRNKAYKFCYSNLFHQGSRYSASVAAIPILFRLALAHDTPDRGDIIQLLLHLAVGYPSYYLTGDFGVENFQPTTNNRSSDESKCYLAVESQVHDLRRLLIDTDASVRLNAAHAIAYFRPPDDWTLEQLSSLVSTDINLEVRATAAMALGGLTPSMNTPESQARSILSLTKFANREDEQPIVRFGALIGLAFVMRDRFSADLTRALVAQLAHLPAETDVPWMNSDMQRLAASVYASLASTGNTLALEALESLIASASGENAKWLSAYLFQLVFPSRVTDGTVLTRTQIHALQIALGNPDLWHQGVFNGESCLLPPPALKHVGLGRTKQDIERRVAINGEQCGE